MTESVLTGSGYELMTPEGVERFLDGLRAKGRRPTTLESYRVVLGLLCASLPEGRLTAGTWAGWKREMVEQGLQASTINQRLSALNSYLTAIGRRDWCGSDFLPREPKPQPELSRQEYRRLLAAARELKKEKAYLLIKLMGSFGLACRDLPLLTVEAVEAGLLPRAPSGSVALTGETRAELLAYIRRQGLRDGLVFRTSSGQVIARKHIHWLLEPIGEAAKVEPRKVSPRCLAAMYHRTRAALHTRTALLAEQDYLHLLLEEQRSCGWNPLMPLNLLSAPLSEAR